MSPAEKAALKSEVEHSKGLVLAIIHPYFERRTRGDQESLEQQLDTKSIEKRIEKFVTSPSKRKPPILLFEDREHADETMQRLKRENVNQKIYLIPTEYGSGRPLFKRDGTVYEDDKAWSELQRIFNEVGIEKLLMGGMYNTDQIGCVNEATEALRARGFNVEISSFAYPVSRKKEYDRS